MRKEDKEVIINGVVFVPQSSLKVKAKSLDGMKYVIIRTYSAGVFAGYLASREGKEVVLNQARRLWYWDGACSLSQLAVDGVQTPANCKFPVEVEEIILTEAIEVIPATEEARKSIASVPVWEK